MNAEQFYEELKDALNYLGAGFHGKEDVTVYYREGMFVLAYNKKEASFPLPSKGDK